MPVPRASRFLILIVIAFALAAGGSTAAGLSRSAAGAVDDPDGWRWVASDPTGWRWE
jgi:hypothetical protein